MKLCVFCFNFYMNLDDSPFSEVTPGESVELSCLKGYWNMLNDGDVSIFRQNIQKAKTCPDYVQCE